MGEYGYATVRNGAKSLRRRNWTYEAIGEKYGVSAAMARKIIRGEVKDSPTARKALGIKKRNIDRLAACLTEEDGETIRQFLSDKVGYDSVTDFWRAILRGDVSIVCDDGRIV